MSVAIRTVAGLALATLAVAFPVASHAQDRESHLERQMAVAAARQAREAKRARVARLRWESERRRSAAHARMRDTMYASTPSAPAVELSCPVVTDDDVRRAVQGWGEKVSSTADAGQNRASRLHSLCPGAVRAPVSVEVGVGCDWGKRSVADRLAQR